MVYIKNVFLRSKLVAAVLYKFFYALIFLGIAQVENNFPNIVQKSDCKSVIRVKKIKILSKQFARNSGFQWEVSMGFIATAITIFFVCVIPSSAIAFFIDVISWANP